MRFLVALFIAMLSTPLAAEPLELQGRVVRRAAELMLLTGAGMTGQKRVPVSGRTPAISEQLQRIAVRERAWYDRYADVPEVHVLGELAPAAATLTVEAFSPPPDTSHAARIAALEAVAASVRAMARAGMVDQARKVGNQAHVAGMMLLAELTDTPSTERLLKLLKAEEGFLIGDPDQF